MQNTIDLSKAFGIKDIIQWCALAEQSLHPLQSTQISYDINSTQFLSRFGIKSAEQVKIYLNSQAGKVEYAILSQEYGALLELEKAAQQDALQELQREKIILGFLLAGILKKRDAQTNQLNRLLSDQINKDLAKKKEQIKKNATQNESAEEIKRQAMIAGYMAQIAFYDKALQAVNQAIQKAQQQIQTLTTQIATINKQLAIVNQNIQHIAHIQQRAQVQVNQILTQNLAAPNRLNAIQQLIQESYQYLLELEQKIQNAQSSEEKENYLNEKNDHQDLINELEHFYKCEAEGYVYLYNGELVNEYHVDAHAVPKNEYDKFIEQQEEFIEQQKGVTKEQNVQYHFKFDPSTGSIYALRGEEDLNELKQSPSGRERLEQAKEVYERFVKPWFSDLQNRLYNERMSQYELQAQGEVLKDILDVVHERLDLLQEQKNELELGRQQCIQEKENFMQKNPQKSNHQDLSGSSTKTMLSMMLSPSVLDALRNPSMKADLLKAPVKTTERLRSNLDKLENIPNGSFIPSELEHELANDLSEVRENIKQDSLWYDLLNPFKIKPD